MLKSPPSWRTLLTVAACSSASCLAIACGSNVPVMLDDESPFASVAQREAPACAKDLVPAKGDWETLRKHYPYHLQGVALSAPSSAGCRTLVIAEPPPYVTEAGLKAVDPARLSTMTTMQHGIGVDGWTKDAVAVLPPMEEREVAALVSSLHRYIFKTAYKARWIAIEDAPPPRTGRPVLDLRVTAAELNSWLTNEKERFISVDGGQPLSLDQVMRDDSPGVYFTASPGLVVWSIPRRADLGNYAVEGRQFALDTDVVLGALANDQVLLLVGREREVPVELLPPLRFETVLMLAGAKKKQLAQSYERNTVFAGRLPSGGDWAPILLSPELIDTEFGSLLDITDQLLKGWSENGETTYTNFDYPTPDHWEFAKPISETLGGNETVFNWNTGGLGGAIDMGQRQLFWVRGTGALTVTYQPTGRTAASVISYEKRAYEFFAKQRDPQLARVIQYTALYQIFRHFETEHATTKVTEDEEPAKVVEEAVLTALTKLADASNTELEEAAKRLAGRMLSGVPMDRRLADEAELAATNRTYLLQVRSKLDRIPRSERPSFFPKIASTLANPRTTTERLLASLDGITNGGNKQLPRDLQNLDPRTMKQLEDIVVSRFALDLDPKHRAIQAFADIDQVKDRFILASLQRPSGWIRTPSVVISTNSAQYSEAIGGHSLDSAITKFSVRPGEQLGKHLADGSIAISLASLDKVQIGPNGQRLAGKPTTPRARAGALALLESPVPRPGRGLQSKLAAGSPRANAGWHPIAPSDKTSPTINPDAIHIRRNKEGPYHVRIGRTGEEFEAWTTPDVADVVARESSRRSKGSGKLRLDLRDFSADEARGLMNSAEIHANEEIFGVRHEVESAKLDEALHEKYDLAKAKIHDPQFKTYADGSSEIGIAVEIPGMESNKPSFLFRIQVFFRKVVSLEVRDKVMAAVQKVMRKLSMGTVTGQDFGWELRNEMRGVLKEVGEGGLKIHLPSETGDITIVEREHPSDKAHA